MIVCVCNRLREAECQHAAARSDTKGAGCVYRHLGVRVRCGRCVNTMRRIVEHVQAQEPGDLDGRRDVCEAVAAE